MRMFLLSLAFVAMLATFVTAAKNPPPIINKTEVVEKLPQGIICDGSRPVNYADCNALISKLESKEKDHVIPECLENGKGYAWSHGDCFISIQNKTPNWGQHCSAPAGYIKRMRETLHKCSPGKAGSHNTNDKRPSHFQWTEVKIGPNKKATKP